MMDERKNNSNSKRIMAVSSANYRGVPLYEVSGSAGVGLFLGVIYYVFTSFEYATAFIDQWYDLKKN